VIAMLRAGMRVRLPSGNIVVLLQRDGTHWICQYAPSAKERGEVELSMAYLRKFGTAA